MEMKSRIWKIITKAIEACSSIQNGCIFHHFLNWITKEIYTKINHFKGFILQIRYQNENITFKGLGIVNIYRLWCNCNFDRFYYFYLHVNNIFIICCCVHKKGFTKRNSNFLKKQQEFCDNLFYGNEYRYLLLTPFCL